MNNYYLSWYYIHIGIELYCNSRGQVLYWYIIACINAHPSIYLYSIQKIFNIVWAQLFIVELKMIILGYPEQCHNPFDKYCLILSVFGCIFFEVVHLKQLRILSLSYVFKKFDVVFNFQKVILNCPNVITSYMVVRCGFLTDNNNTTLG